MTTAAETTQPRWLSLLAAADYTGLSPSTLRRWAAEGRLRLYRPGPGGRAVRLDRLQIDEVMESTAAPAGEEAPRAS
jgi:excisionase family DNA binding protein